MNRLGKYTKLPSKERTLFREALFNLYLSKCYLLIFSFKKIRAVFKNKGALNEINPTEVDLIKLSIHRANKCVFWKHTCLVNTLTARRMLNKRNIASAAFLGVKKSEKKAFIAHAWIKVGDFEIIPKESDFTELHQF